MYVKNPKTSIQSCVYRTFPWVRTSKAQNPVKNQVFNEPSLDPCVLACVCTQSTESTTTTTRLQHQQAKNCYPRPRVFAPSAVAGNRRPRLIKVTQQQFSWKPQNPHYNQVKTNSPPGKESRQFKAYRYNNVPQVWESEPLRLRLYDCCTFAPLHA